MIYGWTPGIGDPTIWGWLTVANYAAAAVLLARVVRALRWQKAFWQFALIVMIALGINKQLDLQSMLTAIGRHLAKQQHWYGARREVQLAFVVAVGLIAATTCAALLIAVRQLGRNAQITCAGLVLVCGFVVIRAASFHHVDAFIGIRFAGIAINNFLENAAILLVSIGAVRARAELRR